MSQYVLGFILVMVTGFIALSVYHRAYLRDLRKRMFYWLRVYAKKRRKFILLGVVVAILASATAIIVRRNIIEAQHQRAYVMMDQLWYSNEMWFDLRIVIDGEEVLSSFHAIRNRIYTESPDFTPYFTEMAFVHSQESAAALPSNIIASWPRDCNWAYGMAAGINWAVSRDEADLTCFVQGQIRDVICFTDFGLSYPLTVADMVDYWEEVSALWQAFPQFERSAIRRLAATYTQS